MPVRRCRVVCFSPTGTTRKVAEAVVSGSGLPLVLHDITLPAARSERVELLPDDLVLLAAPVYYGRVQEHAAEFFSSLEGRGQPAAVLVNYGNRHYDDALLELYTLAGDAGFIPVGAGAFVSEHSFSTKEYPLAANRPDSADMNLAITFGKRVMENLEPEIRRLVGVPGNRPYKSYPDFHRAPGVTEKCSECGFCVGVCPVGAIFQDKDGVYTRAEICIVCQACVRYCPEEARLDIAPGARETREHLIPLVAERKDSQFFL